MPCFLFDVQLPAKLSKIFSSEISVPTSIGFGIRVTPSYLVKYVAIFNITKNSVRPSIARTYFEAALQIATDHTTELRAGLQAVKCG